MFTLVTNDTDVINASEAGAVLNCSAATVTRWAKESRIPVHTTGRRGKREWLFDRNEINRIADARETARNLLGAVPL